jgi:hypothetical protein
VRRPFRLAALAAAMLVVCAGAAAAGEATAGLPNLALPTLGGKQLWADRFIYAGWRIQENALTGHHRLLDRGDVRRAWGDYGDCLAAFLDLRAETGLRPRSRHLVLLIHGLGRSKDSFAALEAALLAAGYEAAGFNYPSLLGGIDRHAPQLIGVLDALAGADKVSFVTHSMGALVLRAALAREGAWRRRIKLGRIVLIAPPNRGSAVAALVESIPPLDWIDGDAIDDLTPAAAAALPGLAGEFGVIAGGKGDGEGFNPLIAGDDDGTLAVAETRLDGAKDMLVIDSLHSFVQASPETIAAVLSFLAGGRFLSPAADT